MFGECREILKQCLKDAGLKNKIHTTQKSLKASAESRIGAVLFEDDQLDKNGSKRVYYDGQRHKRRRKYDRNLSFTVVLGEYSMEEVEKLYENFLQVLPNGIYVDGNWIDIEPKQADWLDEEDSIIKSKCAVQVKITCSGGIYVDSDFKQIEEVSISVVRGEA